MITFKQSPVQFNEDEHIYELEGKRLLGITGLIHSILGLGVYPDASDYVKDNIIPKAGSRGTAVHHAIQTYDQLGIKQTIQTVRTQYGCGERDNIRYVDETWDVAFQLESYIEHLKGFAPLANELTVSDNDKYASQIDNVWECKKTGGIWLVDTKTNNIDLYPKCGYYNPNYFNSGIDALKEYLSWQLSIYAELFEAENPGEKVEGLACNWLTEDRADFWVIERKPSQLVKSLLTSDYTITDNGPVYFHPDLSVFGINPGLPVETADTLPIVAPDVVDYFTSLLIQQKDIEEKMKEARQALQAAMQVHNVKSFDFGQFTATISADSTVSKFDTKRFKAEYPDLYKQFTTQSTRKGGFTTKLK